MLALEVWNDEEGKAEKADIFSMRTVGHRTVPEKVDNVKDAMLISLALYGQIVLKDLSLRTGTPVMQVVKELREQQLAFRDPVAAKWVPADEYLSGHIRDKMIAAAAAGPAYAGNVPALEAVLPRDLGPLDVEARLGAPWIPVDVIEQFATELVNAKASDITVSFEASTASWSLKTSNWRVEYVGDNILQTVKWGTSKRCALVLIEAALNQQPPTITVECDGKRVVDRMATLSAREKWQAIRDQFRVWIYQDADRRDRLLRIYNDLFNQLVERKYDGSHLLLQGMSLVMDPYAKIACQAVMYVVGPNSQEEIRVERPHMNDLGGMAKAVMVTVKSFTTASAELRAEYGRKTNELASAKQLLAQEFEYADRLAALLERQREINAELDLDKDAAGTQTMAAEAG